MKGRSFKSVCVCVSKISKKSETDGTFSTNMDYKRVDYFCRY